MFPNSTWTIYGVDKGTQSSVTISYLQQKCYSDHDFFIIAFQRVFVTSEAFRHLDDFLEQTCRKYLLYLFYYSPV